MQRISPLLLLTLLTAPLVAQQPASPQQVKEDRPNIVFVLADDMGYGDVQAFNSASTISTPNLNRLAQEGMTFTDAHTPSAVCTPTRYGLLTGRYCWRSRLKRGVLLGYSPPLIEPDRPTVASFLSRHGYTCGIVGKWHLGLGFARQPDGKQYDLTQPVEDGPNTLGFDYSYLISASLDMPPYVYIRNGQVTQTATVHQPAQPVPAYLRKGRRAKDFVVEDAQDHLLSRAVDFIRREAGASKPFFLYVPLTSPHKPVLPHPRFRGRTKLGPHGDFIAQVDWTVGELLRTLDECDVADETLVIFTSDNGSYMRRLDDPQAVDHVEKAKIMGYRPAHHTANGKLRGTKADIWEAGHRVPFFARWAGRIAPGSRCDETICLTDFFATTGELLRETLPERAAPDSYSFLPLLLGQSPRVKRPPVIHHSFAGMFAIRDGQWKLVLGNGSGGRERPQGKPFSKPYTLFNLTDDPAERNNVAEQHPQIVARLEKACEKIREETK